MACNRRRVLVGGIAAAVRVCETVEKLKADYRRRRPPDEGDELGLICEPAVVDCRLRH